MDILKCPACVLDRTGNIVHLNSAWRERVGLVDVNARIAWTRLIHSEDMEVAYARFQSVATPGNLDGFECRLLDGNGNAHWFLLNLHPMNEGAAGKGAWLCICTDVHGLKCREIELERRTSAQTDMLNVSVDCIKLISLDGTLVHMNKAGCHALGVADGSSFGMPWLSLLPEDIWPAGEQALAAARSGVFARFSGRSALPGQKEQHWDNMLTPVMAAEGVPTAILCVSREVTVEREALALLQESQERLMIAARVGGLGIWDYDIQQDELHCDESWYRIMGRDPDDPVRSIAEFRPFIHPEDVDRATEVMRTAAELIAAKRDYAIVFRIVRPNGDIRWVRSAACLIQGVSGAPKRAVGFIVDITDERRGELALRDANRTLKKEKLSLVRQSLEDPLTGIANRRHLDSQLELICRHASQTGGSICIVMIDVDHFKAYNDRYGHLEGDAALRRIASALQSVARHSDVVARYGGEEFAFVLNGLRDPAPLLERFTASVADLAIVHDVSPTGYLTVSCGCVVFGSNGELSPALLLRASDEALYQAKMNGRNQCVIRSAAITSMAQPG
ncbi:hypothetical protein BA190_06630 [Labrys sp. WJW]|uniref:sensor domain-containing diguanylate cyclase n=1 Tax=Labrys sp. WJW TaxID=1737983 RepID=UPI00083617A4|nr:diguanylate cyclase [Labrys sp. WJW]OCC05763.1 hypothetical protein BA190_06630 [Labrys sp. WJW]